jgi:hypothetical protein
LHNQYTTSVHVVCSTGAEIAEVSDTLFAHPLPNIEKHMLSSSRSFFIIFYLRVTLGD